MKNKILLLLIIFLAFVLRFWQLGQNPPSLDWDEASLGYNAYSILKTGNDEYGEFLPLSIRSFNDFKPPLYTYLTIGSVMMFDLNEFSTRLASAFLGVIAVIASYCLFKEIFPKSGKKAVLLFVFLFAVSPWHIQFSRIAFEANVALTFFILGTVYYLKGLNKSYNFLPSFLFYALSIYSYHSERLITPLFIFASTILFFSKILKKRRGFIAGLMLFILVLSPLIFREFSSAQSRFSSVTVINPSERLTEGIKDIEVDIENMDFFGKVMHNRRIIYGRDILGGYIDHFNIDFLFLTGDPPGRHHAVSMGMLYLFQIVFVPLGFLYLLKNFNRKVGVVFLWFLLAPVASSLTTGTPHAVRALMYLPIYQLFSVFGMLFMIRKFRRFKTEYLITLVVSFNIFYYLHMYYVHTPREYSKWWQFGYKQTVEKVNSVKRNNEKIIVTYRYDQPYIYFLFYNKTDPLWYQNNWGSGEILRSERKFGDYEFRNIDFEKDRQLKNTVLVGTPDEIPEGVSGILDEIIFLDGETAFRIYETGQE